MNVQSHAQFLRNISGPSKKYPRGRHGEVAVCRALAKLLAEDGHSVSTTTSARTAIELCKSRRFHLIFLDYHLPEMTGDKVLSILRRINPRQRIVLISGGRPYPPLGAADCFISKPFNSDALGAVVAKFA